MSRASSLILVLLLWLASGASLAGELIASVDRNRLALGESLELTLESSDGTLFGRPDLSVLEPLFEVLDSRQVNRLTSVQGQTRVVIRWIISLQPRNQGFVVIPPLRVGEHESRPISLEVLPRASASAAIAPIFIDASLDQEEVYVQAQALLTLRIYHSVSLYNDSSLSPLQLADARVETLGEPRTYEQLLNGVRHGVIEVRYAIFPLKSGELQIPAQVFSATPAQRASAGIAARPGRPTRVRSPSISLRVRPIPAEYPAGVPWLPARQLSLSQQWSPDSSELQVGDSLTRTLTLRAEGLASAQLPPLEAPAVDGLRQYPDQPRLSDENDAGGLLGLREQSLALVPTRSGELQLPAIEVLWWNTRSDRLERSSLPAQRLQARADPQRESASEQASLPQEVRGQAARSPRLWPWQLACLILSGTTLLGFTLWWRARRQPAVQRSAQSGPSPRSLLDEIRRACLANDPHATRQALDAWARQFPETLAAMAARYAPLSQALDELNGALYSESGQHWQGEALWQAVRSLPPSEAPQAQGSEPSPLPPLYPR